MMEGGRRGMGLGGDTVATVVSAAAAPVGGIGGGRCRHDSRLSALRLVHVKVR